MKSISIFKFMKSGCTLAWRVSWIIFLFCFYNCNLSIINDTEHRAQVDSLINQALVLKYAKGIERSRAYLDSAYARFPEAGVLDKYRK